MSIFVDASSKVVVQGISPTSQGLYHALRNLRLGTNVVARGEPRRASARSSRGSPCSRTVAEAVAETGADA